MKVIGTGLSGLVGTRVVQLLEDSFDFSDCSKTTGIDITDYAALKEKISSDTSPWIFHFAAYTDVQGAEKERDLAQKSASWVTNVLGAEYIVDIAKRTQKHVLYLSTDYVFDGKKDSPYTEADQPSPVGWYATTKYEGEKRIAELGDAGVIIRISNPYRAHSVGKKDWVHKILERFHENLPVSSPTDSTFSPTYIDDLAPAIKAIVQSSASGIFHVVASDSLVPYDASVALANQWDYPLDRIAKTRYDQFYHGRAHVPQNGALSHVRTDSLGIHLHSFKDGIRSVYIAEHT